MGTWVSLSSRNIECIIQDFVKSWHILCLNDTRGGGFLSISHILTGVRIDLFSVARLQIDSTCVGGLDKWLLCSLGYIIIHC